MCSNISNSSVQDSQNGVSALEGSAAVWSREEISSSFSSAVKDGAREPRVMRGLCSGGGVALSEALASPGSLFSFKKSCQIAGSSHVSLQCVRAEMHKAEKKMTLSPL